MAPRNLLHTEPFTHRSFYTQELLHTDAFTHRRFYTQTLLHRHFLHTEVPFYLSFRRSNFISCERVVADPWKSQFYFSFSRERLRRVLRRKAAVVIHLHTLTFADLHLHTLTSADLHLHTLTSADLHLHTFTSADRHLHTLTSADLHLHTLTSADLHLHTLTSADLHLHTLTSADLYLHTLTSADHPPPLKMYEEGGGTREFFIHFQGPPPLWNGYFCMNFVCKIKRLPREVGGGPHTFSVFGFKSLFRKRWGGGFIHWFCKAMDVWCSWSFPGESYEIARRFWAPPWNLSLPMMGGHLPPWVNTLIIPKFGGGGAKFGRGGAQMKYHECMHLGGQQQFHAAHSFYMKVVLRSLNVRNAKVCSSFCWFLSIVRVPLSNIFFRLYATERMFFLVEPWVEDGWSVLI